MIFRLKKKLDFDICPNIFTVRLNYLYWLKNHAKDFTIGVSLDYQLICSSHDYRFQLIQKTSNKMSIFSALSELTFFAAALNASLWLMSGF